MKERTAEKPNQMIYLDYAASTPLHPLLLEKVATYFQLTGNAQSTQQVDLKALIQESQQKIANVINADPHRIFFTSGVSESISTLLIGAAMSYRKSGNHIITFATEHQATLATVEYLKQQGFEVSVLPVETSGHINIEQVKNALSKNTILIALNHVCNETGLAQDLKALCKIREEQGILLHIDASQSIGKMTIDLQETPVDFLSLSSHKCYGPQGIGAMYIAKNRRIVPLIHGTHPIRSGTPPHALIALMGEAYALSKKDQSLMIAALRKSFLEQLQVPYHLHTGSVPHILNMAFTSASLEQIKSIRQQIYSQVSSACHEGKPSHVLKARQVPHAVIQQSIRFSFGLQTTNLEITQAAQCINRILSR